MFLEKNTPHRRWFMAKILTLESTLCRIHLFTSALYLVKNSCWSQSCEVLFTPTGCIFQEGMEGKEIGHGWSDGALYYLCATQCNSAAIGSGVSSSTALEWHFKLGHSNLNKLKLLVPSLHHAPILRCESCELSKHTHASLPSRSRSRSNKLLNWFTLICGDP